VLEAVDRSRGRGGAPAAQRGRTTSMPTRIRRILRGSRDEEKTLWFKSSAASVRECGAGDASGRAGAQPYLGPRTKVRRHDDWWGARRAGCRRGAVAQSLRGVHPAAGWRQEPCWSWPQASA